MSVQSVIANIQSVITFMLKVLTIGEKVIDYILEQIKKGA